LEQSGDLSAFGGSRQQGRRTAKIPLKAGQPVTSKQKTVILENSASTRQSAFNEISRKHLDFFQKVVIF